MSKMIFKGHLVTGDFQDKTMTFEIEGEMTLQGGNYTILPTKMYEELVNGAKSDLKALHIDNVSNSASSCSFNEVKDIWNAAEKYLLHDMGEICKGDTAYEEDVPDLNTYYERHYY